MIAVINLALGGGLILTLSAFIFALKKFFGSNWDILGVIQSTYKCCIKTEIHMLVQNIETLVWLNEYFMVN